MNISNTQRVLKLGSSLCRNPKHIWPYLQTNVFSRKLPMDWPYPWWSFGSIEEADKIFRDKKIFEYGSGGSTVRYAEIAFSIISVEDDAQWLEKVERKMQARRNCKLLYRPFDFRNPANFEKSAYLNSLDSNAYNIIIIDGQDWTCNERITCFRHAEKFVKSGDIIVVDDYWRYEILNGSNKAKAVRVFESTGPCRYGVTSTAFFYY
jgi:hypothetical protein